MFTFIFVFFRITIRSNKLSYLLHFCVNFRHLLMIPSFAKLIYYFLVLGYPPPPHARTHTHTPPHKKCVADLNFCILSVSLYLGWENPIASLFMKILVFKSLWHSLLSLVAFYCTDALWYVMQVIFIITKQRSSIILLMHVSNLKVLRDLEVYSSFLFSAKSNVVFILWATASFTEFNWILLWKLDVPFPYTHSRLFHPE